jgi:predicted transcriptional regulator
MFEIEASELKFYDYLIPVSLSKIEWTAEQVQSKVNHESSSMSSSLPKLIVARLVSFVINSSNFYIRGLRL